MNRKLFLWIFIGLTLLGFIFLYLLRNKTSVDMSTTTQQKIASSELDILEGKSLEKLNYQIKIPEDITFGDNKSLYGYSYISTDKNYVAKFLPGTYTIVNVLFPDMSGADEIIYIYLQAFEKDNYNTNTRININQVYYSVDELKKYIVYVDDDIIIYNFASFVDSKTFKEALNEKVIDYNERIKKTFTEEDWPEDRIRPTEKDLTKYEDYSYLVDIADYYTNNLKNLIAKV